MTAITKIVERTINGRDFLRITVELREGGLPGELSDGFSITGSLWEGRKNATGASRARRGLDEDRGGCVHAEILAAAPELAPLVAVHLADPDGTPMHAAANGWYFYNNGAREYELRNYGHAWIDRQGTPHERAARALHIPAADLPEGMDRDGFTEFVASLAERWSQMAAEARALLMSLPSVYETRGYDVYGKSLR